MQKSTWIIFAAAAVIIVIGAIYWFNFSANAPAISPTPAPNETVKLLQKNDGGEYLTDANGRTLYYFPKDEIGKSNCEGACLTAWPVFYSQNIVVKSPLRQNDFTQITRSDGSAQTAYKGWPLYYYYLDKKAGDLLGEGVGNVWYIVPEPFYTVMTQNQPAADGNYLVDAKGMTLYYFTRDTRGTATSSPKSACFGQCLVNWPIFYNENVIAPSLLKNTDFFVITREDGQKQLVYKGWPLYYYNLDAKSGDIKGDKVNNVWFLVKP